MAITEVVAALLRDGDRFLVFQRPPEKARGLLWEFPGGKVEPGETPETALIRECREELNVTVIVGVPFMEVLHEYPDLTIHLTVYHAAVSAGTIILREHCAMKAVTPQEMQLLNFCPADLPILKRILAELH